MHQQYEPATVTREAQVLNRYTSMIMRRAKNPRETKALMVELGERARRVEDVTGRPIEERHAMSVLSGILDPETSKHTAQYQGQRSSVELLKRKVMEFTNLMTQSEDKMDLSKVQQNTEQYEEEEDDEDYIGAFGNTCAKCGGAGHWARECPSKEQGKGKGKGKGASKGKGSKGNAKGGAKGTAKKGPAEGCWTCGGPHYQSDCPQGGQKGSKGGKGGKGEIKALSSVTIRNRFESLTEDDDSDDEVKEWDPSGVNISCKVCDPNRQALMKGDDSDDEVKNWNSDHVNIDCQNCKPDQVYTTDRASTAGYVYVKSRRSARAEKKTQKGKSVVTLTPVKRRWDNGRDERQHDLRLFREISRPGVKALGEHEWEEIDMAVDSGATETVVGENMLTNIETVEGEAYKRGVEYEVASGEVIPNLGEKKFVVSSESEVVRNLTAQVCDVNKALLSVKKMVQAGNRVVFEAAGAYIEDVETGERMNMKEQNGMYVLKLWARRPFRGQAQGETQP